MSETVFLLWGESFYDRHRYLLGVFKTEEAAEQEKQRRAEKLGPTYDDYLVWEEEIKE